MKPSLWSEVCSILRQEISSNDFNVWLSSLSPQGGEINHNKKRLTDFCLHAENRYKMLWVKERFGENIEKAIGAVCADRGWKSPNVSYAYKMKFEEPAGESKEDFIITGGAKGEVSIDKDLSFDSFIEGPSNRLAKFIAAELSREEQWPRGNILILCGSSGLGKTHLMHAMVGEMQKKKRINFKFISAEGFTMSFREHLLRQDMESFKERFRAVDLLLVDNIHFFRGKEKTQDEFFHTVKDLGERKKKMIFACPQPPQYLTGIKEELQTLFAQGVSAFIEKLDLETRRLILRRKAEEINLRLPPDCVEYIAERISRSVRDLEGAIKLVLFYAQAHQAQLNLPLVREALKNIALPPRSPLTIEQIQKAVARHFDISLMQLVGSGRSRGGVAPRQAAMFLCRQLTEKSLAEIGTCFGGRNHTTVLHACKTFERLIKEDSRIKYGYTTIQRNLLEE